jgi:hypothetical protein
MLGLRILDLRNFSDFETFACTESDILRDGTQVLAQNSLMLHAYFIWIA